jgi:5'-nucleotidase/UDP-sugar diphosphatase
MRRKLRFALCLALFLILPQGCAPAAGTKVFITNDVHGYADADAAQGRIGYARLKGAVRAAEAEGAATLLLDSGDVFSGNAFAQLDHGRATAALLGRMGYRAITPGNHAWDHNAAERDPLYYSHVLLPLVRQNAAQPVSVIAANLSRHGEALPGTQREPAVILDASRDKPDGLRVIVAGVTYPLKARPQPQDGIPGYDFERGSGPEGEAAAKQAVLDAVERSLRPYDRPQDIVIVLTHLGQNAPEERLAGPDLARLPNVDFVADGHSHQAAEPERIASAVYGNGGRYLEHFLEIDIDAKASATMRLRGPKDVADIAPDPEVAALVADVLRAQGLNDVLFSLEDDAFSERDLRRENTPLGRLVCRAMLRLADADLAVYNTGGFRAGLAPGPVTARKLYDVIPFDNALATVPLKGRDLPKLFRAWMRAGARGLPQFYGMRLYAWRDKTGRMELAGMLEASGKPLNPARTYTLACNSYMLRDEPLREHGGSPRTTPGNLTERLVEQMRRSPAVDLDELRDNRSLLLYPDRQAALAAWKADARR